MKKFLLVSAVAIGLGTSVALADTPTYNDGDSVVLTGKIVTATGWGLSGGYEAKQKFTALQLNQPFNLQCENDNGGHYLQKSADKLHIATEFDELKKIQKRIGKNASIRCSLAPATTGYHLTPVMCFDAKLVD